MNMKIYSIYDIKTAAYMRPFFLLTDGQATRAFQDLVNDATHEVSKHPEDFTLHRLGEFDDQKGEISSKDRTVIATALELRALSQTVNTKQLEAFEDELEAAHNLTQKDNLQ